MFIKVLNAVCHLHKNQIIHGDIKLTNIIVDSERNVKLIDFGYSSIVSFKSETITSFSGTPVYLAPEIIKKLPYNGNFKKDLRLIFGHWAFYYIGC